MSGMYCKACGELGHKSNNKKCPEYAEYAREKAAQKAKRQAERQAEQAAEHDAYFAGIVAESGAVRRSKNTGDKVTAASAESSKVDRTHSRGASVEGTGVEKKLKGTPETPHIATPSVRGQMGRKASVVTPSRRSKKRKERAKTKKLAEVARQLFTTTTSDKGKEEETGDKLNSELGSDPESGSESDGDQEPVPGGEPGGDPTPVPGSEPELVVSDEVSELRAAQRKAERKAAEAAEAVAAVEALKERQEADKEARAKAIMHQPPKAPQTLIEINTRRDIEIGELVAFRTPDYPKHVAGFFWGQSHGLYAVSSVPGNDVIILQPRHITRLGFRSNRVIFHIAAAPNRRLMRVLTDKLGCFPEGSDTVCKLVRQLFTITDVAITDVTNADANAAPSVVGLMTAAIVQGHEHQHQRITTIEYESIDEFGQGELLPVSLEPVAIGDLVIVQIPRCLKTRHSWYFDVCWRATVTAIEDDEVFVTYPPASRRLDLPTIFSKSHVMGVPREE